MTNMEKIRNNIWVILFFLLSFVLTILIAILLAYLPKKEVQKKDVVGAVFIGSTTDGGWNQSHYEGLQSACEEKGLPLVFVANVSETEDECLQAVRELVNKGATTIFLTSDGFGSNVYPVVEAYPQVMFYTISPEAEPENELTYYGRMYQMRYLGGMLAAHMTKTNVLGYVAAMDNPQVDRGINAYLLGARSVNPAVTVKVKMVGSWFDAKKERTAATELIEQDHADVLTYHGSAPETIQVCEEKKVYSIGYIYENEQHSEKFLAALVFHWDILYKAILQDFIRGNRQETNNYWWGAQDGVVAMEHLSPLVDRTFREKIKSVEKTFDQGYDVFLGEIKSNSGRIMCHENERISDRSLLFDMNWLVEGVTVDE